MLWSPAMSSASSASITSDPLCLLLDEEKEAKEEDAMVLSMWSLMWSEVVRVFCVDTGGNASAAAAADVVLLLLLLLL